MAAQQDGLDYIIKTWVGKLKVGELVFPLLAGACGSSVLSYVKACSCAPKFFFFDTVAWTAFINALIDMIIHLLGLWERLLWIFQHPAVYRVLCVLAVIGFLIGSSLATSCAKDVCVTQEYRWGGFILRLRLLGLVCSRVLPSLQGVQKHAKRSSSTIFRAR